MLRSAGKNWHERGGVDGSADYERVAAELEATGETALATRWNWRASFCYTSRYDGMIATELERLSVASGHADLVAKEPLPRRVYVALESCSRCATEKPASSRGLYIPAGKPPAGLRPRSSFRARSFLQ